MSDFVFPFSSFGLYSKQNNHMKKGHTRSIGKNMVDKCSKVIILRGYVGLNELAADFYGSLAVRIMSKNRKGMLVFAEIKIWKNICCAYILTITVLTYKWRSYLKP